MTHAPDLLHELQDLRRRVTALEIRARDSIVPQTSNATVRNVIAATAQVFDVPESGLLGRYRRPDLVEARQVAMALAVHLLSKSMPAVGRAFDRDHTTVLHAMRRVSERVALEPDFAARVARVRTLVTTVKGAAA